MAFAEPFERIIRDGCLDGSLRSDDPAADAPLLVNVVGWTYIHMRQAHGWSIQQITAAVIGLAMGHVAPLPMTTTGDNVSEHRR
jgi:hypothetical protein